MYLLAVITDSQQQKCSEVRAAVWNWWQEQPAPGFWNLSQKIRSGIGVIRCYKCHFFAWKQLSTVCKRFVLIVRDFMFITFPIPIIPVVFRFTEQRRKYWSFLLSRLVNFLCVSGRANYFRHRGTPICCVFWMKCSVSYLVELFLSSIFRKAVVTEAKGKRRGKMCSDTGYKHLD